MDSLEISARTEEEAVAIALEKLGATRDEVEVVVLKKGKAGFFGIGSEEATVSVTRRQPEGTEQEAVNLAKETLERILSLMKVPATIEMTAPSLPGAEAPVVLNIVGDDLGVLIGRRGQTLLSLQHLVFLIVSHRLKTRVPTIIDVEGYRERRREALTKLALRLAEAVKTTGTTIDLEPMPANERRVIHLALQGFPGVTTESVGEGENRKVTIKKQVNEP